MPSPKTIIFMDGLSTLRSRIYDLPLVCFGAVSKYTQSKAFLLSKYTFTQVFDSRIACPSGLGFDRAFYRSVSKLGQTTEQEYEVKCETSNLSLLSPQGTQFALLDTRTSKALRALLALQHVQFTVTILPDSDVGMRPELNGACQVSVNIYGTATSIHQVGRLLTEQRRYLQHPPLLEYGVEYINPHYFVAPGTQVSFGQFVKIRYYGFPSKGKITSEVIKIMDSLGWNTVAAESTVIDQLQTPLLPSVSTSFFLPSFRQKFNLIKCSHQQHAFRFVRMRETTKFQSPPEMEGDFAMEIDSPNRDTILPTQLDSHMHFTPRKHNLFPRATSGLLADSMGFGKTLSMLSSIVDSLEDACRFEYVPLHDNPIEELGLPTRATLVVVPSARGSSSGHSYHGLMNTELIEVWKAEIQR